MTTPADQLTREEWLRLALVNAEADLKVARKAKAHTAITHLTRLVRDLRADFDAHLTLLAIEQADPLTEATDAELLEMEIEVLRSLPTHMLEPLAEVVLARLGRAAVDRLLTDHIELRLVTGGDDGT